MSTILYDGEDRPEDTQINPQQVVNPLPLRSMALRETNIALLRGDLILREGEHIDRVDIMVIGTQLYQIGKPQNATKEIVAQHSTPLDEHEVIDILTQRNENKVIDFHLYALTLGLIVAHQAARLQSATYNGRPPRLDPSLIPLFFWECQQNIPTYGDLGSYIEDQLEIIMSSNGLYSPDEMTQLRTLLPQERKPLRRGTTKAFSKEQLHDLRKMRKEITIRADEPDDMSELADLIENMRFSIDGIIDSNFNELPEDELDETKFLGYHCVNLGFYFAYWLFSHDREVKEFERMLD